MSTTQQPSAPPPTAAAPLPLPTKANSSAAVNNNNSNGTATTNGNPPPPSSQQQQQQHAPTITSLSDSARTAQAFFDAVRAFTASATFHGTAELIDEVPRLRRLLGERERDLRAVAARADEQRREHERAQQAERLEHERICAAFLDTYNRNYEGHRREREALVAEVGRLEGEARGLRGEVEALRREGEELARREAKVRALLEGEKEARAKAGKAVGELKGELERRNDVIKREVERRNTEVADMDALLRKTEADLGAKVKRAEAEAQKARASLVACHRENEELQKDLEDATERLAELEGFAEPLSDEKWENSISLLDELWRSAHDLISSYFRKDLPKEILNNSYAWTELRDPQDFSHKIPLPRSNSPCAKSMRIAVILAILARLIDKYLFQPSYILSEESGLREVLIRQAIENSRREAFTRGIFLATFEDEQAEMADELVTRIVKELMHHIHDLLPAPHVEGFRARLDRIVQDARDIWWKAQRLRLRLEPDFQVEDFGWERPIQFQFEHAPQSAIANGKVDTPQQSPQSRATVSPMTPTATAAATPKTPSGPASGGAGAGGVSTATASTTTTTTTTTPAAGPPLLPPLITNGAAAVIAPPDQSLLLIFPRIYIVEDDDPEPVTPGTVLLKSQAEEAGRELLMQQSALANGIPSVGRVASHRASGSGGGGGGGGGGAGNGVMRVGGPRPRRLSVPQMEEIPEVPTPREEQHPAPAAAATSGGGGAGDEKKAKDFLGQGVGG